MPFAHIGVFLMALGFAVVSITIAKLLLKSSRTISTLSHTVQAVESKLDKAILELEATIVETGKTAIDVETKLDATTGLFVALKDVGETTAIISNDLHTRTERYAKNEKLLGALPFIRAIQFSEFGVGLVRSWTRGRNASN